MKKLVQKINVPREQEEEEHYNPAINHATVPLIKKPTKILVFYPTNFQPIKLNETNLEKYLFFCQKNQGYLNII